MTVKQFVLDKQAYNEYLSKRYKNQKLIEERMRIFDRFNDVIFKNETTSLSDIAEKDIGDFIETF